MVNLDPRAPVPWPIKIAKKFGVTSDEAAARLVVAISIGLIIIAFLVHSKANKEPAPLEIDPKLLERMERGL